MKKILLIAVFLIGFHGFSQGGPGVDVIKYRGKATTTVRDTWDVPNGETWMIHNVTTNTVQFANADDVWIEIDYLSAKLTGQNRSDDFQIFDTGTGVSGFYIDGVNDRAEIRGGVVGTTHNLYIGDDGIYSSSQSDAIINSLGSNAFITKGYADANYSGGGSGVDLSANYTWTGDHIFQNSTYFESDVTRIRRTGDATVAYQLENSTGVGSFGLDGTSLVIDVDASFNNVQVRDNTASPIASFDRASKNTTFYGDIIKDGATSDDVLLGDGTTTSLSGLSGGSDDQTLSLGGTGNKDLTIESGNTIDLTGVNGVDPDNVVGTISGRTGTAVTGIMKQTEAQLDADGTPNAGEVVFCSDCPPMEVQTSATITVDGYKGYDDRALDAATFSFSSLEEGATVVIEINRATDASYSGITFAHTKGTFSANTRQFVTIYILPSGDALRVYEDLE